MVGPAGARPDFLGILILIYFNLQKWPGSGLGPERCQFHKLNYFCKWKRGRQVKRWGRRARSWAELSKVPAPHMVSGGFRCFPRWKYRWLWFCFFLICRNAKDLAWAQKGVISTNWIQFCKLKWIKKVKIWPARARPGRHLAHPPVLIILICETGFCFYFILISRDYTA